MQWKFLVLAVIASTIAVASGSEKIQCQPCQKIVSFIKRLANNVPEDEALRSGLVRLCKDYNVVSYHELNRKHECENKIDHFAQIIRRRLRTDSVCEDINACYGTNLKKAVYVGGNNQTCDYCQFVVGKLRDIFSSKPTEMELKYILEDGCNYLGSFKDECIKMVDDYIDVVMNYMEQIFDPANMCSSLHYCEFYHQKLHRVSLTKTKPFKTEVLEVASGPVEDMNCDLCKRFVKIIQTQLRNNVTDEEIVNVLEEVCQVLPKGRQASCLQTVSDYARNLIKIIAQDVDPDFACTLAGLCNNNIHQKIAKKSNGLCVQCEMLTHFIQTELYNYNNELQIENFIKNHLCKKASFFMDEKSCDNFIEQYAPILIQAIAQEVFDPKTFCYKEVPVCKPKVSYTSMLNPKACDMCVKMVEKLHLESAKEIDIEHFIERACNHYEPTHKLECRMMARAFAPYIFDVIKHHDNPGDICQSLDICAHPGKVNLLGGHKCTFGPSYWCLSAQHADACSAKEYCSKKAKL